jgi:hypothetical protein
MSRNPRCPGPSPFTAGLNRRDFLWRFGGGLGGFALASLLGRDNLLAGGGPAAPGQALPDGLLYHSGGLHHPPKVKRIIQLFMNGGMSQVDTFDRKPKLDELHGKPFDPGKGQKVESVTGSHAGFPLMKCPFEFKQHGQSGRWVSSVFPHIATCVDDIAFLMSMTSKTNVHGPGSYMMNTGFVLPGFPCMGSWVSYALGSLSDNLPSFVVMPDPRGLPYNNLGNFSSGFLPVAHAGTVIKPSAPNPISDLFPPKSAAYITKESEQEGLSLLNQLNREHAGQWGGDSRLDARIQSYELAAKMQLSAPEVLDLSGETDATKNLYGMNDQPTQDFGRRCLVARRMLERGVRFVQVWSGAGGASGNWDNHGNIPTELPAIAGQVDKPVAGLLKDLKSRGMFDDTLLLFNTEFGRQPFTQGQNGRDHNGGTSVCWMAGAGVRGGVAVGQSDEWGWRAADPLYCYDFHATVLHLLGVDHERLTFRYNGADRRLTDVHGHVLRGVLA